jgi:hypothetical protein
MRDLKFWVARLDDAKKKLPRLPIGMALNQEPLRREHLNWGHYRAAYTSWLFREREFQALARRRERLKAQIEYFKKQIDGLSSRSARILRNPVI